MFNFDNIICFGSARGDIHFGKLNSLYNANNQENYKYCLGKTYAAHFSFINQIECLNN